MRELSDRRVLLVHGWLYTWAGAERVLEELSAIMPQADVLAGVVTPEMRAMHPVATRARETWVGSIPGARTHHRWFLPLHALAFATYDTREYELVISISHGFEKMTRVHGAATHVCYCLSPPRYLWDLRETYDDMATIPQRAALRGAGAALRAVDQRGAAGVHEFISISRHVADRVRRCYGRDSAVVYPPVQRKGARLAAAPTTPPSAPYLLSLGRLVPYKRVDLAILAAEQLHMKLIVAGDGPERARLESIAGDHTEFLGAVSEDEAARLLAGCLAFVFCAEEDFGIAPLEANAHGKPVVAYRRGAAEETLVSGRTAVFFDRQEAADVAAAIVECLETSWDEGAITENAERFAPARFRANMREQLDRAMATR